MTAKHTPGPWAVAYQDTNGQAVVKAEHIEVATCWHHCVGAIEKEMAANARLIAAAPDLLAELRTVVFHLIRNDMADGDSLRRQAIRSIEATIAKATGEQS